ncbi:MAG: MerR family DNA-binding transcriptional regulator [Oscillospiraceae bacterium]
MGKKETLLSIGDFSKVTGVSIKALRYYDEAGILTPAFVDSNSGYRYYAFSQKAIVDAVQFCVELGIPLKQFPEYTNEPVSWIRYADLVERGEEIVQGKIKTLQEHLALLKQMRKEIQRAESSCQSSLPAR